MAELADVELDAAALKNVAGGDCYAVDGCMEKGCNWYFCFCKDNFNVVCFPPVFLHRYGYSRIMYVMVVQIKEDYTQTDLRRRRGNLRGERPGWIGMSTAITAMQRVIP